MVPIPEEQFIELYRKELERREKRDRENPDFVKELARKERAQQRALAQFHNHIKKTLEPKQFYSQNEIREIVDAYIEKKGYWYLVNTFGDSLVNNILLGSLDPEQSDKSPIESKVEIDGMEHRDLGLIADGIEPGPWYCLKE